MAYPQAWFQRNDRGQVIGSYSQVPIPKDGTPTWLPLIPEGRFLLELGEGKTAVVDIKPEYLRAVVENFRSGFPGPAGVPVDQRADHSRNPEGAYAFYEDVRYEPGDGLWGLFTPTKLGQEVIGSGALPYVSPVFSIGDLPDPVWGRSNILIEAALCTQPQFGGQPQMILASAYAPTADDETSEAASAADSHEGVSDMAELTAEELQAKIDEAVAAAKAEWEQAQADAAQEKADELEALKAQIADLQAKAWDAEALQKAFDELKAKQAAAEAQARLDEATRKFEEIRQPVTKVLPDGSEQTDVVALTPEAVKIAAAATANPLDADAVRAMTEHMLKHAGFEMVTVTEGKPALVKAAAPAPVASGQVALEMEPWTDECKTYVAERVATAGITRAAAYLEYCGRLLPA
jgi:hypothetical protein